MKQRVVLPEAEAKRHEQSRGAHHQSTSELVEVIDDAQAVFMADGPENPRHGSASG
jgi:hypothetical protein